MQDEFLEKLVGRAKKMQPADPLDPKTRLGAIVSQEQMQTVLGYIEAGKKEGAKLMAGGNRVSVDGGKGFFIEPTIFGGVNNDMKIAQEEIFGPVLATLTFDDVDRGRSSRRTDNPYGLAAAVWTRDVKKAHHGVAAAEGGHGVDQHLRLDGRGAALRRIQEFGLRPRAGQARDRALHGTENRVDEYGVKQQLAVGTAVARISTVLVRASVVKRIELCQEK